VRSPRSRSWAAPSPCGLGSRSIARAEGPARPSPALRVSGLTADDRCRGSLRLAVAHHCDRRGRGRPDCLHASAMAQDDPIGLTSSRVRPPQSLETVQAGARERTEFAQMGPHRTGHAISVHLHLHRACISAVQAGRTRANRLAHWDRPGLAMRAFQLMSTRPGPCFCPASNLKRLRHDGGPEGSAVLSNCTCPYSTGHRDCRGLAGPLVLG
jgi:hypothetical protein